MREFTVRGGCGRIVPRATKNDSRMGSEERLVSKLLKTVVCALVMTTPAFVGAQTPAAPASVVVANPTYIVIPLEVTVNKPVDAVWARIGHFCGIAEWAQMPPCTM